MASRIAGADLALLPSAYTFSQLSVWPVKFAEYLGAGIPLIVEREVGEDLSNQVEKWKLGCVVDQNSSESYAKAANLISDCDTYKKNCINYARKRMDLRKTADQYFRLYKQVLG